MENEITKNEDGVAFLGKFCSPESQRLKCDFLKTMHPSRNESTPIKYVCILFNNILEKAPMGKRKRTKQCLKDYGK